MSVRKKLITRAPKYKGIKKKSTTRYSVQTKIATRSGAKNVQILKIIKKPVDQSNQEEIRNKQRKKGLKKH